MPSLWLVQQGHNVAALRPSSHSNLCVALKHMETARFPSRLLQAGAVVAGRSVNRWHLCGGPWTACTFVVVCEQLILLWVSVNSWHIIHCICHFPFVFTLQRIFRRLRVIILPTPENVKRHNTGQQRPIFNCSLQLRLTGDSGTPRHPDRSSTVHCQSELLGTDESTVFAGRWWGVCPICSGLQTAKTSWFSLKNYHFPVVCWKADTFLVVCGNINNITNKKITSHVRLG